MAEIRPFRRSDRDQLTALVNMHVEAVLPGVSLSPNAVLSQLEREPAEAVVDPWVRERHTLVAVVRDAVVGAAHLLRYGDDDHVGPSYRGAGEIRWVLFRPGQHADGAAETAAAADALLQAALATLRGRGAARILADGTLPAPGVYGVSDRWPHVEAALLRAGFVVGARTEIVMAAAIDDLPRGGPGPVPGLVLHVALGGHATRFSARVDDRVVGFYEVASDITDGGTLSRLAGWADGWELWVAPDHRRRGVATWLIGHAADRLRFAGVRRVLDYAIVAPAAEVVDGVRPFLAHHGFRELTRNRRDWVWAP